MSHIDQLTPFHLLTLTPALTPGDDKGNLQEGEAQLMMVRMLHTLQVPLVHGRQGYS